MSKRNLLLIQPHSDDILFSASKYLFNREDYKKVTLFTVEGGNLKRREEDIELVDLFRINEYINSNIVFTDSSYHYYYKKFQDGRLSKFDTQEALNCMAEIYGNKFLIELKNDIRKIVKKYKKDGYEVVCCLGVGHPTHLFVRNAVDDLADVLYRDFPHSYKRKGQEAFMEVTTGLNLVEEYFNKSEHEMKFEIAYNVYKSQRSLLFFEKGYIAKQLPEEFYR